jgi:hypothetical protein
MAVVSENVETAKTIALLVKAHNDTAVDLAQETRIGRGNPWRILYWQAAIGTERKSIISEVLWHSRLSSHNECVHYSFLDPFLATGGGGPCDRAGILTK